MKYYGYYLFRPSAALKAALQGIGYSADDIETGVGPLLWSAVQGGRTALSINDYQKAVAEIFIAYITRCVLGPADTAAVVAATGIPVEDLISLWQLEYFNDVHMKLADAIDELGQVAMGGRLADSIAVFGRSPSEAEGSP